MNIFLWVYLILTAISLGLSGVRHGKLERHDFPATLIGALLALFLLYMGGAFDNL